MTLSAPTVSVVLPTYNRADLLPRAIGSVLAEKNVDLELIVVDDCSQEDIRSLVAAYDDPRLVYLRRVRNGGAAAARNHGVSHARGEFVAFQDSDDEWLAGKLMLQIEIMRKATPDTAMVFCGLLRYGSSRLSQYPPRHLVPAAAADYHHVVKMNAVAFTQTWLVRRQALQAAGPFDERLKIWDDWDMLLRLTERYRVQYLPQALVLSHHTTGSISSDLPARARDLAHIIAKYECAQPRDHEFLGRLYYLQGRFQCLEGQLSKARESLIRALKYDPLSAKPAILLLLSLFGRQGPRRFLKTA